MASIQPVHEDRADKLSQESSLPPFVLLVEDMLTLHKQLTEAKSEAQKTVLQRQIESTDAEIDRLVYDLYGLTDEEIAIVEGNT